MTIGRLLSIKFLFLFGGMCAVVIAATPRSIPGEEAVQAAHEPVGEQPENEPGPIRRSLRQLESQLLGATPEERARLQEERKRLLAAAAAFGTDPTAIIGYHQLAYGHSVLVSNLRFDTTTATMRLPVTPNWLVQLDLPYSWSDQSQSNVFPLRGVGDMTMRMGGRLYASENIALFVGADASFPTASEKLLGTGKYTLGPGVGLAAPLPRMRSVFVVTALDNSSLGGDPGRPHVHFAVVQPAVVTIWSEQWWSLAALTWNVDWEKNGKSVMNLFGQVGYRFDKHWNIFVGPGVGVAGKDNPPLGLDWTVQAGVRWVYTTPLLPRTVFQKFRVN